MSTDKNGWIRWIANGMQLIGYFMLIHDGFAVGLAIKAVSDVLLITWGWYNKLWDVVIITGIFTVMNSQRLYEVTQWNTLQLSVAHWVRTGLHIAA